MARLNKHDRSNEIFIGVLMSLPWWVPFVLAALVYTVLSRISLPAAFLWACIIVFAGLVIPFIKWRMKELLESATSLPAIRRMSWQNFERLVGEAFRRQGYVVVEVGGPGPDGGVDLILHRRTEKIVVQCKHWQKPVGVTPVRELRGVVAREKARRGILVTSSSYTEEALAEAKGQPLELIDGLKLLRLVQAIWVGDAEDQQETPRSQEAIPTPALETLCPSCGSKMVVRLARQGPNAGGEFWGCSTFPKCRGIRPVINSYVPTHK